MRTTKFNDLLVEWGGTERIEQIYTGSENACRCGCAGRYFEPGSKGFARALNKLTRLNPTVKRPTESDDLNQMIYDNRDSGEAVTDNNEWIDFAYPDDKTITVYFKTK